MMLGGYVLETRLGEGGMGTVFRATHPRFPGHAFAIKVIRAQGAPLPDALARFQRETQALARTTAHENIVRLLGAGVERDTPYYVMELAPGISLARLVEEAGPLEPTRAARLVREVAAAIVHAHSCGVLHRDLKPENVIVDGERVRVCDFGLAKIAGAERLTRSGAILGTPAYSAPEQLAGGGRTVGPAADVYSLGALFLFLLTGAPPFEADALQSLLYAVMHEDAPAPSARRPELPAALDAVVGHALEKDPARRYPTAKAFLEDVERFLAGSAVAAPAPVRRRGRRALVGGVALALVAGAALAVARGRSTASGAKPPETLAEKIGPLFADDPAASPAELLVKQGARLLAEGKAEAAPVFSEALALAAKHAAAKPDDPGVAALRALVALARGRAPLEALGTGRVDRFALPLVAGLVAGSKVPGPAGARLALLAADALVCNGRDAAAREALARAPEAPAARALAALLELSRDEEGYAKLVARPDPDPVRDAVLRQRFFARCGAPGAIDDAALAGPVTDAVLIRLVAGEPLLAFEPPVHDAALDSILDPLVKVCTEMRINTEEPAEQRVAAALAANRERALATATAVLRARREPRVYRMLTSVPQLGASTALAAVLGSRSIPSSADWLACSFNAGARSMSRSGIEWQIVPAELDGDIRTVDALLEGAARAGILHGFVPDADLERAVQAASALKRLEVLDDATLDAGEHTRLAAGTLIRMEALARLGGPCVLPFRARARALAFPGPLGVALARLDLFRAERSIVALGARKPEIWLGSPMGYAFLCAGAAPDARPGERDLGRELYRLAVAWAHEDAIVREVSTPRAHKAAEWLRGKLAEQQLHAESRRTRRFLVESDFELTSADNARLASKVFELEPPTVHVVERPR